MRTSAQAKHALYIIIFFIGETIGSTICYTQDNALLNIQNYRFITCFCNTNFLISAMVSDDNYVCRSIS